MALTQPEARQDTALAAADENREDRAPQDLRD